MIKNISVEMDGFHYNIVQMPGEQAFKMQLKLMQLASAINTEGLSKLENVGAESVVALIKGVLCAANSDMIIPLVKELLSTCGIREINSQLAISEGFNPERHCNMKKPQLDHFYGKDVIHLYTLLYEILRANYEDFFMGAKKWLGFTSPGEKPANSSL